MKKQSKKNLKIISATAASLFSLVAVFTATIAWFALNHQVDGNGMTVKAKANGPLYSSITIHRCIISECTSDKFVFNKTAEVAGTVNPVTGQITGLGKAIEMDQYSDINPSQPILILFTYPDDTEIIDNGVILDATSTFTGTSDAYLESLKNLNPETSQKLSSIVNFYSRTADSSSEYFTSETNTFTFMRASSERYDSSFVTTSTNTITAFTRNIEMYNGNSVTKYVDDEANGEEAKIKYLAVVMDYNVDAINYIYSANVNSTNPGELHYVIDWSMKMR